MKLLGKLNRRLLGKAGNGYPGKENVAENFRILHAEKNVEGRLEAFYGEKLKLLMLVLGAGAVLTAALWVNERSSTLMEEGHFLPRKEKTYTREIWAVPDKESGKDKEAIVVEVEPQGLKKEQVKELLAEETARMESYIIGENSSLQEVRTDLNLIREIEGTPVTVDWELDSYEVLNLDGSIRKEKVTEDGTIVSLRGRLRCEDQESLYEKKLCTYPRTDSRYLTDDMAGSIHAVVDYSVGICGVAAPAVVLSRQICNSKKVSDHHAIIPTAVAGKSDINALPAGEREILGLIAKQVLRAVSESYRYRETTVVISCGGNTFTAKGKTILATGWKSYNEKEQTDKVVPELADGDELTVASSEI